MIVTDNTGSLDFRLACRRYWGGYHFPRHWNLFNERSLRLLAAKTGFEVGVVRDDRVSPVNWTYSVRNALDDWDAPRWLVDQFSLEHAGDPRRVHRLRRCPHRDAAGSAPAGRAEEAGVSRTPPVAVLGAGIAGLVARAASCARNGVAVNVLRGRPGHRRHGPHRHRRRRLQLRRRRPLHHQPSGRRDRVSPGGAARCATTARSVRVDGKDHAYPTGLLTVPRYVRVAPCAAACSATPSRRPRWPSASGGSTARSWPTRSRIPLVEAWSGVSAEELAPSVADKIPQSIPQTLRLRFAARRLNRAVAIGYCGSKPQSASVYHVYPQKGVATLCEASPTSSRAWSSCRPRSRRCTSKTASAVGLRAGGRDLDASAVISTAPISVLPKLVEGTDALEPYRAFRFRGLVLVNLKLKGRGLLPDTMMWFPQGDYSFFRLMRGTAVDAVAGARGLHHDHRRHRRRGRRRRVDHVRRGPDRPVPRRLRPGLPRRPRPLPRRHGAPAAAGLPRVPHLTTRPTASASSTAPASTAS